MGTAMPPKLSGRAPYSPGTEPEHRLCEEKLDREGILCTLKVCASARALPQGKRVHSHIVKYGLHWTMLFSNLLIQMYGKCGYLLDAYLVFERIPRPNFFSWNIMMGMHVDHGCVVNAFEFFKSVPVKDVITWNTMIAAYVRSGEMERAFELFEEMPERNISTWNIILSGYAQCGMLDEVQETYEKMPTKDFVTGNIMISVLANHGRVVEAFQVFKQMPQKNIASWNTLIAAYASNGQVMEAIQLCHQMQVEGLKVDRITFLAILGACSHAEGKYIHSNVIYNQFESDVIVGTAIINMYSKCGCLHEAQIMFDKMQDPDALSWNSMIAAHARQGNYNTALQLFQQMPERTAVSWNSLIAAYAQDGKFDEAIKLFSFMPQQNVVAWNGLLTAYTQLEYFDKAFEVFEKVSNALRPNRFTFISILEVCSSMGSLTKGKRIHSLIVCMGIELELATGSNLVNMYGKCGNLDVAIRIFEQMPVKEIVAWNALIVAYAEHASLEEANQVFEQVPQRNVVSFNAMIAAYGRQGQLMKSLQLFDQMQQESLRPDKITFICLLDACSDQAALKEGKKVHKFVVARGFASDTAVGTSLINMYAKCGDLSSLEVVFQGISMPDKFAWTSIIVAFSHHGDAKKALGMFQQMFLKGWLADNVTIVSILSGCSHSGLLDEGCHCFISACHEFKIEPTVEQYNCLIDHLGRMSWLDEACDLIESMTLLASSASWMALIGACYIYSDAEKRKWAVEKALQFHAQDGSTSMKSMMCAT